MFVEDTNGSMTHYLLIITKRLYDLIGIEETRGVQIKMSIWKHLAQITKIGQNAAISTPRFVKGIGEIGDWKDYEDIGNAIHLDCYFPANHGISNVIIIYIYLPMQLVVNYLIIFPLIELFWHWRKLISALWMNANWYCTWYCYLD